MDVKTVNVPVHIRLSELENEISEAYASHDCARLKLLLNQNQQLCWALWQVRLNLAQKAVRCDLIQ